MSERDEHTTREQQVPTVIGCWEYLGDALPGPLGWPYRAFARIGRKVVDS